MGLICLCEPSVITHNITTINTHPHFMCKCNLFASESLYYTNFFIKVQQILSQVYVSNLKNY